MSRRVFASRRRRRDAVRSEHGEGPIVVDTGFRPETARRRGRAVVADPIEVLARLGIAAAEVRDVVLTHLHYDHSGYLSAFSRARFGVQDDELAFWTGRHAGHDPLVLERHPPPRPDLAGLAAEIVAARSTARCTRAAR